MAPVKAESHRLHPHRHAPSRHEDRQISLVAPGGVPARFALLTSGLLCIFASVAAQVAAPTPGAAKETTFWKRTTLIGDWGGTRSALRSRQRLATIHTVNRRNEMGLISPNWLWIVSSIGMVFYLFHRDSSANSDGYRTDSRNLLDEPRHGGHDGRADHGVQTAIALNANALEAAIDPVGREPLSTARALTFLYQGRAYYFG